MPLFRAQPSQNLNQSIRQLLASGGPNLTPVQEMMADQHAARTVRDLSLAEKARAEAEQLRLIEARQNDPALATQFASRTAGVDDPTGSRLMAHLRGDLEQPGVGDVDDAMVVGKEAQPYVTGEPVLAAGQRRLFESALAGTIAAKLATGKTNAAQFAQGVDRVNETALVNQAANIADPAAQNQIIAPVSGRQRQPFVTNARGVTTNRERGTVNEGSQLAGAFRDRLAAQTGAYDAAAGASNARGRLSDARAVAAGQPKWKPIAPEQKERWISEVALREWKELPSKVRRGMNYDQHLQKVRERFMQKGDMKPLDEVNDARKAILNGADAKLVKQRFRDRMGFQLPEVEPDDDDDDGDGD